ncbi:hypothetical protein H0H93_006640 [Arthromyces matolae]|nr:hypothetical protein H0H93_006640 [Arthromyces matolae]
MKNFLAPCAAIFLLSASIAGASPIPSGNNAYAIRDIISEPHMFPPEVSGDIDLWDGFGEDIHRSGVTDEGLASRSTKRLVPTQSAQSEGATEAALRSALMNASGAHPSTDGASSATIGSELEGGANGARPRAPLTSVFSTARATDAHEAAVTLSPLTGGANSAVTSSSQTGSANGLPPSHVASSMASSTSST